MSFKSLKKLFISSAEEVIFSPVFVCLLVGLSSLKLPKGFP